MTLSSLPLSRFCAPSSSACSPRNPHPATPGPPPPSQGTGSHAGELSWRQHPEGRSGYCCAVRESLERTHRAPHCYNVSQACRWGSWSPPRTLGPCNREGLHVWSLCSPSPEQLLWPLENGHYRAGTASKHRLAVYHRSTRSNTAGWGPSNLYFHKLSR